MWSHFTSLKMHRAHAHRKLLPKWVPDITPPQVAAAHRKSCFVILSTFRVKNVPLKVDSQKGQNCIHVVIERPLVQIKLQEKHGWSF